MMMHSVWLLDKNFPALNFSDQLAEKRYLSQKQIIWALRAGQKRGFLRNYLGIGLDDVSGKQVKLDFDGFRGVARYKIKKKASS